MEIMKLDIADLEYIKRTIDWMTEHMDLKDQNQDIEDLHNLTRNSLTALERGVEYLKNENSGLHLQRVVGSALDTEFLQALNDLIDRKLNNEPTKKRF